MKSILFVPVPSDWYGKPWSYVMTFDEAVKALDSDEQKLAVTLMREIDLQLGIDAELSSSINDSPDGASVMVVHMSRQHWIAIHSATSRQSKERRCWTSHPTQRSPNTWLALPYAEKYFTISEEMYG